MSVRRKAAPEAEQWQQQIAARLDAHDQQLRDHDARLVAAEQQLQEYVYEFDMVSRLALRNARRLDRVDRHRPKKS